MDGSSSIRLIPVMHCSSELRPRPSLNRREHRNSVHLTWMCPRVWTTPSKSGFDWARYREWPCNVVITLWFLIERCTHDNLSVTMMTQRLCITQYTRVIWSYGISMHNLRTFGAYNVFMLQPWIYHTSSSKCFTYPMSQSWSIGKALDHRGLGRGL